MPVTAVVFIDNRAPGVGNITGNLLLACLKTGVIGMSFPLPCISADASAAGSCRKKPRVNIYSGVLMKTPAGNDFSLSPAMYT
jgi:hypothetical protein